MEHDKRRQDILRHSFDAFVEEGFDNVTFQKIADRAGVTRTTLYIYFRNKRDIFSSCIKQFMSGIENSLTSVLDSANSCSCSERLKVALSYIADSIKENRKLFLCLLPYFIELNRELLTAKKEDEHKKELSPERLVRRRVLRTRHLLSAVLIEGIKRGEFWEGINIRAANDLFYGLLESAAFRIAVLGHEDVNDIKASLTMIVESLTIANYSTHCKECPNRPKLL